MVAASSLSSWKEEIVSTLSGTGETGGVNVKVLRKMILLARQLDDNDKTAKKTFKSTIQQMEAEQILKVATDGQVTLVIKKTDKEKKKKRKHKDEEGDDDDNDDDGVKDSRRKKDKKDKKVKEESSASHKKVKKEKKERKNSAENDDDSAHATADDDGNEVVLSKDDVNAKGNPSGITRLFVGNLPFKVDETSLGEFLPGLTHIKWITDMETGRFYGSSFVEMQDAKSAAAAVAKSGQALLGRPIKINYAPPRPGDAWPPAQKSIKGNGPTASGGDDGNGDNPTKKKKQATAGGMGIAAMGEKPVDCHKLFVGNLSYEIDDDAITKFFATVEAEVKAIRWIHHKETGFFKGVYVFSLALYSCDGAFAEKPVVCSPRTTRFLFCFVFVCVCFLQWLY
jgi:nucleolin